MDLVNAWNPSIWFSEAVGQTILRTMAKLSLCMLNVDGGSQANRQGATWSTHGSNEMLFIYGRRSMCEPTKHTNNWSIVLTPLQQCCLKSTPKRPIHKGQEAFLLTIHKYINSNSHILNHFPWIYIYLDACQWRKKTSHCILIFNLSHTLKNSITLLLSISHLFCCCFFLQATVTKETYIQSHSPPTCHGVYWFFVCVTSVGTIIFQMSAMPPIVIGCVIAIDGL